MLLLHSVPCYMPADLKVQSSQYVLIEHLFYLLHIVNMDQVVAAKL